MSCITIQLAKYFKRASLSLVVNYLYAVNFFATVNHTDSLIAERPNMTMHPSGPGYALSESRLLL